jgi:hypothetical protein
MDKPSTTPLVRKLGIKAGHRVALVDAPPPFVLGLGPLPAGVVVQETFEADVDRDLDVIVAFVRAEANLVALLPRLRDGLAPAGGLWLCWLKKSSGVASDLSEAVVRAAGLAAGLVDNKVCAIDATWSALRFVFRLADRPALGGSAS